jgi:hypothetical protein
MVFVLASSLDWREPPVRRQQMDYQAQLASPVRAVFARLAAPARLGEWLREVITAPAAPPPGSIGEAFPLTLRIDAAEADAAGELTAYEPPWLVGYRLAAGPRTYLLRATCTARDGGTQIHVHQASDGPPLTVDLYQLQQALAAPAPPPPPGRSLPARTSEANGPGRKET